MKFSTHIRKFSNNVLSITKKEEQRLGSVHMPMVPKESWCHWCDVTPGFSIFALFLVSEACTSLLECPLFESGNFSDFF